jgi:putative OPT family oligopeptide transporter
MKQFNVFAASWEKFVTWKRSMISLRASGEVSGQGGMLLSSPGISPAYIGVGYIIGPKLASLNFSGGLLAWGLFVPILTYFLGPSLPTEITGGEGGWPATATNIWRYIVRPIAIGGMLMSAAYTLFRMRNSLATGLQRSIGDVKKAATGEHVAIRTERDINFKWVTLGILLTAIATFFIYLYFAKAVGAALVATVVMVIAGFFFAAVSGYLVGIIGSSNNPISGLTLSTLLVAALLMYVLGARGDSGVAAVLGVAGVVCVAAAVAGEMLQDLKVGHILGGTPWKMQSGDLIGIFVASLVMFIPIIILHQGDINMGGEGLGGRAYPAPQASLMALLSRGIVGGEMAWPLIVVGMLMGLGFILMQVRSPMLVSVGMYLPLETTFAIFIGGVIKGIVDQLGAKRKHNDAQKARVENIGILLAAGLIAGEALIGLLFAGLAVGDLQYDRWLPGIAGIFPLPFIVSLLVLVFIGWILVRLPLKNAGSPDQPAPPSAAF